MAPRKPWTDEDTARLTELHAASMSLHAIAKDMGRSKATISKYADLEGLSFGRAKTAKAAEAVHVDNRSRRVALEERWLRIVDSELDTLDQEARVYSFGGADNRYAEEWLDRPPPSDRRTIIAGAAAAQAAANKLHAMNTGHQAEQAVSALAKMQQGLEQFAAEYEQGAVEGDS